MKIIIPGNPKAQKRAEFRRMGKFVNTYDPSRPDKDVVKQFIALTCKQIEHIKPPIKFQLTAYMPIPGSLSLSKQNELKGKYHIKKPDSDNILKFYKDTLEGIFYDNDSQIAVDISKKIYDNNPRTEIEITTL